MYTKLDVFLILLLSLFVGAPANAANESSQNFTLDGQLFHVNSTTPLIDAGAKLTVQILDPSQTCVLYEETQNVNTLATNGFFSIQVGSLPGNAKRTGLDAGQSMQTIIQNLSAISGSSAPGKTCTSATYSPNAGDIRYFRITVIPSSGSPDTLAPDMVLDSVPSAIVAQSVQGLDRSNILRTNTASGEVLTQTNLESLFTAAAFANLAPILAGNYVQKGANGAVLPSFPTAPSSPVAGDIWYDSTGKKLVYSDGTTNYTLSNSGSGVTSITTSANLSVNGVAGATLTTTGTLDLAALGTAGTYTKVTVDAKGRVSAGTTLVEADIPTLSTAGKVVGTAITSGTIGGSTSISTSGNLQTTGDVTTKRFFLFDHAGIGPNFVGMQTVADMSAGGASYTLTFPNSAGAANQVLATNGTGVLSWVTNTDTSRVSKAGDTMTGLLLLSADPVAALGATTKQYADSFLIGKTLPAAPGAGQSGQALRWNNATPAWEYFTPGTGTVTNVSSANTDIGVATGSTTPVLTLNSGTGNNQIVKLSATAKLPAVDGSQLTNLIATQITSGILPLIRGGTGAALAPVGKGEIIFSNSATDLASLAAGTSGYVLTSAGVGNAPTWATPALDSTKVLKAGDTMTGLLLLSADPSAALGASTKQYVDSAVATSAANFIRKDGAVPFTGDQSMGSHKITNLTDPTSAQDAATKNYADTTFLKLIGGTMTGPLINNTSSASTAVAVTQAGAGYAATFMGGKVGIGTTSPSGVLDVQGGTSGVGSGIGINLVAQSGQISGSTSGGDVTILAGNSNGATGGSIAGKVKITGGSSVSRSWSGAEIQVGGPDANNSIGGAISIMGGPSGNGGPGGALNLTGGTSAFGAGGNVNLTGGVGNSTGTSGNIILNGGAGTAGAPAGNIILGNLQGNVGIGTASPSALLNIKAGTATAGTAPLKLTSGTNLSTPEAGAIEYDGTSLFYTDSGAVRRTIASVAPTLTNITNISNSGGNITLAPATGTGSVVISSGTSSTNTTTGALVVTGGIGASGNIFAGGSINSSTTVSAGTYVMAPQIYGSSASAGTLNIDATTHATKGNIILNGGGGYVGIGNPSPTALLAPKISAVSQSYFEATNSAGTKVTSLTDDGYGRPDFTIFDNASTAMFQVHGNYNGGPIALFNGAQTNFPDGTSSTFGAGAFIKVNAAVNAENGLFFGDNPSGSNAGAAITHYVNSTSLYGMGGLHLKTSNTGGNPLTRMTIDPTGNVGIGTATPVSLLQVSKSQAAATEIKIENRNTTASTGSADIVFNGYRDVQADYPLAKIRMQPSPSVGAGNLATNGNLVFMTGGYDVVGIAPLERMRIDYVGNVGIGTASPTNTLSVSGAANVTGDFTTTGATSLGSNSVYTGNSGGAVAYANNNVGVPLRLQSNNNGSFLQISFNSTKDWSVGIPSADTALAFVENRSLGGSNGTERMRIAAGGNVGIGTNTPGGTLDVQGGTAAASTAGSNIQITSQSGGTGNTNGGNIQLLPGSGNGTGGAGKIVFGNAANMQTSFGSIPANVNIWPTTARTQLLIATGGGQELIGLYSTAGSYLGGVDGSGRAFHNTLFGTYSASGNLTLDSTSSGTKGDIYIAPSGGNVGIGTTSPQTTLQVAGVISPATNNTYTLGNATYRFTEVYATNGVINTSDRREKKDIYNTDLGLDFINKLRPVSYRWNTGVDNDVHYGLIAQEAEQVIAEVGKTEKTSIVTHDETTDRYGVRYSELISPLIKAVQELYNRLMGVESDVTALKAKDAVKDREIASVKADNESKAKEIAELKAKAQKAEQENAAIKAYLCSKDKKAAICK